MDKFQEAINLLEDKQLVWSQDFDAIRVELSAMLKKAAEIEYAKFEAEIDELTEKLIGEGENNVRGTDS